LTTRSVVSPPRIRPWIEGDLLVALGLALGPVVALGFSRFAYALLLPPMRENLHWSYTQAGGINTANAIGYIIGAATAALAAKRLGDRQVFIGTLAASAAVLLLSAAVATYGELFALRVAGGLTTAMTFVIGSSLASRIRASLLPVYFAGVGLGVVLSGAFVPAALSLSNWRLGWLVLGVIAVLTVLPAWAAARAVPDGHAQPTSALRGHEFKVLGWAFISYILFGAGYVSYMTFSVALLHHEGMSTAVTTSFFIILGVASITSTLLWGPLLHRLPHGTGPAAVAAVVLAGTLPLLLGHGAVAALISALIFGSAFMAGPTAYTVISRRILHPAAWTAGIAALTTAFALGQSVGPIASGLLSDGSGGVKTGLWLSPILLALAIGASLLHREHEQAHGL
jgi:predicted MFS family arabinose efflux permease